MKRIIIILIITIISGFPVCTQAQLDRQPFSQQSVWEPSLPSSPADELLYDNPGDDFFNRGEITVFRGPAVGPPNDDTGGGGFVGAPVSDALGLVLLAAGYGVIRRRRTKN